MNEKKRDYSLDFVKIIATIFIVFHHYQQITGTHFAVGLNFYGGDFYFGFMVELFFVLSGMFMHGYIEKIQNGLEFGPFYFKRFLRLFPLLVAGAITFEIFLSIYQNVYMEPWLGFKPTFWGTVIASLGIQDGWVFANPYVNNPTWYVSVLLLCYCIFYFLTYISGKLKFDQRYLYIFMIFLGIGINTYGINMPFLNASSSRGYYAFFFGVILAGAIKNRKLGWKYTAASLLMVCVLTCLIAFYSTTFMYEGIGYIMTFIYYPALIVFFKSDVVSKIISGKIIGRIGQISFDVFVWHIPLFLLMFILIRVMGLDLNLHTCKAMLCFTIICYVVGTISFYCYEQPVARCIDRNLKITQKNNK